MRLMSTSRVGRASRIAIIGTSVCPPATTRAFSSAASIAQASSMVATREYSNDAAFMGCYAGFETEGCDIVVTAPIWLKSLSHYRNRNRRVSSRLRPHTTLHRRSNEDPSPKDIKRHDRRPPQGLHPQHRRSAVAGISEPFRRRAVEALGDARHRRLASHRLPHLDVSAQGLRRERTATRCRSRSTTSSKARA